MYDNTCEYFTGENFLFLLLYDINGTFIKRISIDLNDYTYADLNALMFRKQKKIKIKFLSTPCMCDMQ